MKRYAWCGFALLLAAPLAAQDLSPALDPVQIGQGQVMGAAIRAQADRAVARRKATPQQRAACAQKRAYRAKYGGGDLRVRRLYNLCYKAGL